LSILTYYFITSIKLAIFLLLLLILLIKFKSVNKNIVILLSKIKVGKFDLPDSLQSILSLSTVVSVIFLLFYFFVPIMVKEIKFLSTLNFTEVFTDIISQFPTLKNLLLNFGTEKQITDSISQQINKSLNFNNIGSLLNGFISTTSSVLGGTLAVLFITFFLLKDNKMLYNSILLITPTKLENEIITILRNTQSLLSKYFIGLSIDILIVSLTSVYHSTE
jgi:predicted PurR-regulated permease PerM